MRQYSSASALLHPAGDIAGAPTGPYYLLMVGNEGMLPDVTNITVLSLVADALHTALRLDSAYKATDIIVTPAVMWNQSRSAGGANLKARCPTRQLFELYDSEQTSAPDTGPKHVRVVLQYKFATASGLPTGMQLSARMSAPATTKALTHQLTDDGIVPLALQLQQYFNLKLNLTTVRSEAAAKALLQGQAWLLEDYMIPIGKVDCEVQLECDATTQGASGQLRNFKIVQEPLNGGKECPAPTGPCTLPIHCKGLWVKHNCSAKCGAGKLFEVRGLLPSSCFVTCMACTHSHDSRMHEMQCAIVKAWQTMCHGHIAACRCTGTPEPKRWDSYQVSAMQ